ncbi:hypothetical protein BDV97DRAFT_352880 [Delphinella strobiligena]|nr:hypothetical protein BDV97DRAFT_352880 [Delphinella strobiligena]
MAEPQPAGIREGDPTPSAVPSSAEDRKTAAALSNLDAQADNDTTIKQADTEALGNAMKGLSVGTHAAAAAQKKAVKVDSADVTMLAQQLDVPRTKATELLKSHDADVVKAIAAWIT